MTVQLPQKTTTLYGSVYAYWLEKFYTTSAPSLFPALTIKLIFQKLVSWGLPCCRCIYCSYVKTKQQRPHWLRSPSVCFDVHVCELVWDDFKCQSFVWTEYSCSFKPIWEANVYNKQSLHAHKSLGVIMFCVLKRTLHSWDIEHFTSVNWDVSS